MGLEDTLLQLRMTTKQLERLAAKAQKDQVSEKAKVKKALEQKNVEGAQIYAENSIRKKNEYLNYLRLASRVDAVQSKVKSAVAMQSVVKNIGSVTRSLEGALKSMDLEKISKVMEKFEEQFTDLDVRSNVIEGSMSSAMTLNTPQAQVDSLIRQVADENGLEIMDAVADAPSALSDTPGAQSTRSKAAEEDLTKRLASLRN